MTILDLCIALPTAYFCFRGFKKGLIIELIVLLAIFVGAYAGIKFSDATSKLLREKVHFESEYMPLVSFVLTFLAVGAIIYFGGKVLEKMIKTIQLGMINKLAGAAFGMVKGLYIVSLILVFFDAMDEKVVVIEQKTKNQSMLYNPVRNLALHTIPGVNASQIFLKNVLKQKGELDSLPKMNPTILPK